MSVSLRFGQSALGTEEGIPYAVGDRLGRPAVDDSAAEAVGRTDEVEKRASEEGRAEASGRARVGRKDMLAGAWKEVSGW